MTEKTEVRPKPCAFCPYRRDVPSGVWSHEEYEKLRAYDGDILDQMRAGGHMLFMCHQADGQLCAGWAGHRSLSDDLLAVRLHLHELDASVLDYEAPVPLFSSGAEAADHGQAELEYPSDAACGAIEKIARVRSARGKPVKR
jgi:hypothetical protein